MSFRNTSLAAALGLGLAFSGCDTVDNVDPRQSVTPEQATETIAGYTALASSAYDALQDADYYGQQFMLVPDALADNIQTPPTSSNRYPNFVSNVEDSHLTRWGGHYGTINTMNFILASIDDLEIPPSVANGERDRTQIKGEAYFHRALNYFDLIRTKAYEPGRAVGGFTEGVILRTTPTNEAADADFRARASVSEVYDQILSDLDSALELLGETNFRRAGTPQYFATKGSTRALMARVNLYAGNWADAIEDAQAAIDSGIGVLVEDDGSGDALGSAWRASTHPESIFELNMTPATDGGVTGTNASLQSVTDPRVIGGFLDAIPTPDLIAAYSDDDPRAQLISDEIVRAGQPAVTYSTKYSGTSAQFVDRVPVIRVSEMYLIQAEAHAELGQTSEALAALNTFLAARGDDAFGSDDGDDETAADDTSREGIIAEVIRQRRLEFAFEGHRFFDLKRRGLDVPKPQTGFNVLPYTDFRILAPLPDVEVTNNPLLNQNPGY